MHCVHHFQMLYPICPLLVSVSFPDPFRNITMVCVSIVTQSQTTGVDYVLRRHKMFSGSEGEEYSRNQVLQRHHS